MTPLEDEKVRILTLVLSTCTVKGAAKVMAKDLVRTRNHVQKMIKMKTQLQAVSLRLQTVKSQNAMATAIRGVAKVRLRHDSDFPIDFTFETLAFV